LAACEFADVRHGKRLGKLLERISFGQGSSMPWACQDWANTKAAYRFFANGRVDQTAILSGHFKATQSRFDTVRDTGPVLVLHDTTEFSYRREKTASIGLLKTSYLWRDREGRPRNHTLCGLLMHSGLVVTTDGVPLGLAAIKFWTRKKFKGTNALKKKINPTRVPIEQKESLRWIEGLHQATKLLATPEAIVHIRDRESDIYELFLAAQDAGTHFLFRTCVDRLTGHDGYRVSAVMEEVRVKGLHRIEVRDKKGNVSQAVLELRYRRLRIQPPAGKKKRYPELDLTVLHAQERGTPLGRDAHACDEEDPVPRQLPEPHVIVVAPINGQDRTRFQTQPSRHFQFAIFAVGDHRERGQVAVVVQQQMQLDRALPLAILGPVEHGCRQLDDAAVQTYQLILEAELPAPVSRLRLSLLQQLHENRLVEFPGRVGVGIGQGRFLRRGADAQLSGYLPMAANCHLRHRRALLRRRPTTITSLHRKPPFHGFGAFSQCLRLGGQSNLTPTRVSLAARMVAVGC
jgi:hypothetical protein